MYKGNNKTAITSQNMIADALLRMLKDNKFSEISISALCKEAQISRQTFYTLFSSKENVVKFIFDNNYKSLNDLYKNKERLDLETVCKAYCSYVIDNYEFLSILIENKLATVIYNSFKKPFISCNKLILKNTDISQELFSSFMAGALTSITITFIKEGIPKDRNLMVKNIIFLFNTKTFF